MGGVLVRLHTSQNGQHGYYYKNDLNFGEGDIHKFVTIDTPHEGSFAANALIDDKKQMTPFGRLFNHVKPVARGAIYNLRSGPFLTPLSRIPIPSHAITASGGISCYLASITAGPSGYFGPDNLYALWNIAALFGLSPVDILSPKNDLIVQLDSQRGGLSGDAVEDFGFSLIATRLHTTMPKDKTVAKSVETLLNEPVTSQCFDPMGFRAVGPGAKASALGTAARTPQVAEMETEGVPDEGTFIQGLIQITDPVSGTVVSNGEHVPVTVDTGSGFVPTSLGVLCTWTVSFDSEAPFEVAIDVPGDVVGDTVLVAVGIDADGNVAVSQEVSLTGRSDATLTP
jgi:hypothetical protein